MSSRIAGILMECNPLHEGHRYILEEARRRTDAEAVIVLLSGDFVQRGIPAIESKEYRTRQLLAYGADLVLELPVVYGASSAEYFARGGMEVLRRLGIVTDLVFGSESGDCSALLEQAQFLADEPADFPVLLRQRLAEGLSYPAARMQAAAACSAPVRLSETSNDILAVEYLKALLQAEGRGCAQNMSSGTTQGRAYREVPCVPQDHSSITLSGMQIHAVPRISAVSASALREQRRQSENGIFADDFSEVLLARLLDVRHDAVRSYADYAGISRDLSNRIEQLLPEFCSWTQFCSVLKTRNITYSAVSRGLLHLMLGITKDYEQFHAPFYVRVLGCRKGARPLLGQMAAGGLNVLVQLPKEPSAQLLIDVRASELYDYISRKKMSASSVTKPELPESAQKEIPSAGLPAERISEYTKPFIVAE